MKFEIINPSDEAYFEADSYEVACIASMLIHEMYGIKEDGGTFEMPPPGLMLLADTLDAWFTNTFGKTFKEISDSVDKRSVKKALLSTHLVRERTSVWDVVGWAQEAARNLVVDKDEE